MVRRGDVVIVYFPFLNGEGGKKRPALVVQSDLNNRRLDHTMLAMMTGNVTRAAKVATQLLVDPSTPDGASTGLSGLSALKCEHLLTIHQRDVRITIGQFDAKLMARVDACLKAAFDLK